AVACIAGSIVWLVRSGTLDRPVAQNKGAITQNQERPTEPKKEEPKKEEPKKEEPKKEEPKKERPPSEGDSPSGEPYQRLTAEQIYPALLKSTVWIVTLDPLTLARLGFGSGVLVHRNQKLILTNYHVVQRGKRVFVCFPVYRNKEVITDPHYYV